MVALGMENASGSWEPACVPKAMGFKTAVNALAQVKMGNPVRGVVAVILRMVNVLVWATAGVTLVKKNVQASALTMENATSKVENANALDRISGSSANTRPVQTTVMAKDHATSRQVDAPVRQVLWEQTVASNAASKTVTAMVSVLEIHPPRYANVSFHILGNCVS